MNFFINGFLVVQACLGRQAIRQTNLNLHGLLGLPCRIAVPPAALGIGSRFGWLYRHEQCASSPGCQCRGGIIWLSKYGENNAPSCGMGLLCRTVCVVGSLLPGMKEL